MILIMYIICSPGFWNGKGRWREPVQAANSRCWSLGLAPIVINEIFQTIKKIKDDGMTILLVEQNSQAALTVADRGYIMETGMLKIEDTAENLLDNDIIKKSYLGIE